MQSFFVTDIAEIPMNDNYDYDFVTHQNYHYLAVNYSIMVISFAIIFFLIFSLIKYWRSMTNFTKIKTIFKWKFLKSLKQCFTIKSLVIINKYQQIEVNIYLQLNRWINQLLFFEGIIKNIKEKSLLEELRKMQ